MRIDADKFDKAISLILGVTKVLNDEKYNIPQIEPDSNLIVSMGMDFEKPTIDSSKIWDDPDLSKDKIYNAIQNDLDRLGPFMYKFYAHKYVGYNEISQLTGKSLITVKRATANGKIKKLSSKNKNAHCSAKSAILWHYGNNKRPQQVHKREISILWRIILGLDEGYHPRYIPSKKNPKDIEQFHKLLMPEIMPIPNKLEQELKKYSVGQLRFLQAFLIACFSRGNKLKMPKSYISLTLGIFTYAQQHNIDEASLRYELLPLQFECPECKKTLGKHSSNRIKQVDLKFSGQIENEATEDSSKNSQRDFMYNLTCPNCKHEWLTNISEFRERKKTAVKYFKLIAKDFPNYCKVSELEYKNCVKYHIKKARYSKTIFKYIAEILHKERFQKAEELSTPKNASERKRFLSKKNKILNVAYSSLSTSLSNAYKQHGYNNFNRIAIAVLQMSHFCGLYHCPYTCIAFPKAMSYILNEKFLDFIKNYKCPPKPEKIFKGKFFDLPENIYTLNHNLLETQDFDIKDILSNLSNYTEDKKSSIASEWGISREELDQLALEYLKT